MKAFVNKLCIILCVCILNDKVIAQSINFKAFQQNIYAVKIVLVIFPSYVCTQGLSI